MLSLVNAVHLIALVFGSAASLGNIYLAFARGPHDLDAPGFTNTLRKYYRLTALGAIAVLWASGLILLFARYGIWLPGYAFNVKISLAVLLTLIIVFLNLMAPSWARRGGPPRWVPALHYAGAFLLISTVLFAAFAFK